MSRKNKCLGIINTLEYKLEEESVRVINEEEKITPYHIIEALKKPVNDEDELTCIGRLIQESLEDQKYIEAVSWVAFHFDFPGQEFSYSERDVRNWIAVRTDKQKLLDTIHEIVREKYHQIQDIYAPSVVTAKISKLYYGDKKLIKDFRKRWWLYRLEYEDKPSHPCLRDGVCHNKELDDIELICFQEESTSNGKEVTFVSRQPVFGSRKTCRLSELLGETQEETLKKFHRFKDIVYTVSDDQVDLNCDFYVRIPLFFHGAEQEYMTEIFVALSHARKSGEIVSRLEIGDIIRILDDIVPSLKTCVSLVNSQVAYSLGEVTRRDKMAGLLHAVIRHDINNFAAAVDGSISQMLEYWDILKKKEAHEILKEIRANVALSTMFIDLDFLWDVSVKDNFDNFMEVSWIREELDNSWQFSSVLKCEFTGDWKGQFLVPKVCRIVLSHLLRNAIDNNDSAEIRLDCHIKAGRVNFGCLSEKEFPESWKQQAFEAALPLKIPRHNRGLWICRYIVESLEGELYLAPPLDHYKTNIRFEIPIT